MEDFRKEFEEKYHFPMDEKSFYNAIDVLQGHFVSKEDEYKKYSVMNLILPEESELNMEKSSYLLHEFRERLCHSEFSNQVEDVIKVGLKRYSDIYATSDGAKFVLYEKYSRRDVSLLMNCGKDLSSTMYGSKWRKSSMMLIFTALTGLVTRMFTRNSFHTSITTLISRKCFRKCLES